MLRLRLAWCRECQDDTEHTWKPINGSYPLHDLYTCVICGANKRLLHRRAEDFRATGYPDVLLRKLAGNPT